MAKRQWHMQALTRRMREALREQRFPKFVLDFVQGQYPQVN